MRGVEGNYLISLSVIHNPLTNYFLEVIRVLCRRLRCMKKVKMHMLKSTFITAHN